MVRAFTLVYELHSSLLRISVIKIGSCYTNCNCIIAKKKITRNCHANFHYIGSISHISEVYYIIIAYNNV